MPRFDQLICIYTCAEHQELLGEKFRSSPLWQYLQSLPNTQILEVYANPELPESTLSGTRLTVTSVENYGALTLKTYKMMEFCVENFVFNRLFKIDITTIMDQFDGLEYEGRKSLDLEKLIFFLRNADPDQDYDGFILHANATRENAEDWARKKGLQIDFEKIFDVDRMPPFFSGKCYSISRRFAKFIKDNGLEIAQEHMKYFPGAEDLMIARLYLKFKAKLRVI